MTCHSDSPFTGRCSLHFISMLILSLLLGACGGGGGGGDVSGGSAVVKTGQFIDAAVEGLRFETATQTGMTNANGEFQYLAGESVSFYIGDILLGSATGGARITPFELAGMTIPTTPLQITKMRNELQQLKRSPAHQVMNIALFLQYIDEDADPDNGIVIPATLHTLAQGRQLQFKQSSGYGSFYGAMFEAVLNDAYQTRIFTGDDDRDRDSGQVLEHLMESLGNPLLPALKQAEFSEQTGNILYRRITNTYNDAGQITLYEDKDASGLVTYREDWLYDDNGNETDHRHYDAANLIVSSEHRKYDDRGNLTLFERDDDGAGLNPVSYREVYKYDEMGNQTLYQQETYDQNFDGISFLVIREYDTDGKLVIQHLDWDGDGPSPTDRYYYDGLGRTFKYEKENNNGEVVIRSFTFYDEEGHQIQHDYDGDGDGAGGVIRETWGYDGGFLVYHAIDPDGDGEGGVSYHERFERRADGSVTLYEGFNDPADQLRVTRRETTEYDEEGRPSVVNTDEDGDGADGVTLRARYEYDANGLQTLYEQHRLDAVSGAVTALVALYHDEYDADGNLVLEEQDYDGDGSNIGSELFNAPMTRQRYDANGNMTLREQDSNGQAEGGVIYRDTYEYDTHGYRTLYERDDNGDGGVTRREVSEFDANGNQTLIEIDSDGGGLNPPYRVVHDYNDDGSRVRSDIDDEADGSVDRVVTSTYVLLPVDWFGFIYQVQSLFFPGQPQGGDIQ